MSSAALSKRLTPEQYLALERKAEFKSEYDDGYLIAMAGATREHNLIAGNLHREISTQLKDRPCETYISDMRVCIGATGRYAYPDVVVACDEPEFLDSELDTLLNPTVLIEILSASTESGDRGEKFAHYRRLPSLREYVLVSQYRILVERYARRGEDWVLTELSGFDDVLCLDSIGCRVPLREVYARVRLAALGLRQDDRREG